MEVCTTDDFTLGVDTLVYQIDPAKELMKIAYPIEIFERNVIDGRAMLASILTLTIGNHQGMGDVEYAKMHDFYALPAYLRLFDGPCYHQDWLGINPSTPIISGGMNALRMPGFFANLGHSNLS